MRTGHIGFISHLAVRGGWLLCCCMFFVISSFAQDWEQIDRDFGFTSLQRETFRRIRIANESKKFEECISLCEELRQGDAVTTDVQMISHLLEGKCWVSSFFEQKKRASPLETGIEEKTLSIEDRATLQRAAAASQKCREMALKEKERTMHKKYDFVISRATLALVNAAYYGKDYDKAIELCREIMELYPLSSAAPIAISKLQNCYIILDRSEECIPILESHIKKNPKTEASLGALRSLEHHYGRNNDYEKALEINKRILADYPNLPYRDRIEQQIKWLEQNKGKTLHKQGSCCPSHSTEKIPAMIKNLQHEETQLSEGSCGSGCGKGKEQSSEQPSPIKGSCSCGTPRSGDYTPAKNITDH